MKFGILFGFPLTAFCQQCVEKEGTNSQINLVFYFRLTSCVIERNLLKGITTDENTAAHDFATLGVVNVRYCGYIVVVKLEGKESSKMDTHFQSIELLDQPEGGANALNINRFLSNPTTCH
ncbi:unnamed protein product, partial [Vitis vinifera]|uniref:Uncharacterized protein n=1 Tax=Vitis vinifera TaxID=29760 RepID=D7TKP8_VITVI